MRAFIARCRNLATLPAGLLLAGVVIGIVAAGALARVQTQETQARFHEAVEHVSQDVAARFAAPMHELLAAEALFAASREVDELEFLLFAERRLGAQVAAGMQSIAYLQQPPVTSSGTDQARWPIRYVFPQSVLAQARAWQSSVDHLASRPLEQAVDAGVPALVGPLDERATAPVPATALALYLPVYRSGTDATRSDERRLALSGMLVASLDTARLMGAVERAYAGSLAFRLRTEDGAQVLFATAGATDAGVFAPVSVHRPGRLQATQTLSLADRSLALDIVAVDGFEAASAGLAPWMALLASISVAAALAQFARSARSGQARAEARAQALTDELERLAMVARRTSNGVVITDAARRITWVNEGFSRITGWSMEEVLGAEAGPLQQSPRSDAAELARLGSALDAEQPWRGTLCNCTRAGRDYWADIEVQPLRGSDGRLTGWMAIQNDVTEQREAQRQLADERRRLAMIVDGTGAGTWERDFAADADRINETYAQMLGDTIDSLRERMGTDFHSLVHPEDVERLLALREDHLSGRVDVYTAEYRMRHRDGHWVWIQCHGRGADRAPDGRARLIAGIHLDISARKEAERQLALDRVRLNNIRDGTHVGTWEWNVATDERRVDERWAAMVGWTLEELQAAPPSVWQDLHHPDDTARCVEQLSRHFRGELPHFECELRLRHRNGHDIWVLSRGKLFSRDAVGQPQWMAGTHMDITRRKRDEQALQASQALLDATNRLAGVGGWSLELQTGELTWTDETCRIHDRPPGWRPTVEEALAYFVPEARESVRAALSHGIASGEPWEVEEPLVTATGRRVRVRAIGHIERVDGRPHRLIGAFQDVTERHAMEEEVRRTHALLRGSIDALDDAFALFDPDDRLVLCNEPHRALYPIAAPAVVPGASFESILRYGAERGQYAAAVGRVDEWIAERMARHREPCSRVTELLDDGRAVRVVERRMESGHTVGFRVDVTELVRASEAAQQASEAKSRFLASMSHEIRTPMNAVLGMLALLQRTALTARQADYVAKTEGAARSLLGLLNDILDFSKVEAGKMTLDPQPFELDVLLHDLAVLVAPQVGARPLELVFDADPALPRRLVGDALRLQQVLLNLVGNAIKFTEAGEVVLSMTAVSRSEQAVTLDIAVQDTGIGIAPEHQRKIFEGFTQAEVSTSRRFGGTGLGVAICQRLIRLMGGELSLVSEPGQGSRFSFRVELAMVGPTAESGSPALAGRSVLLVESQAAVRGAGLRLLQGLGARTEAVADLTGAIEQACRAGQAWDAVIVGWRVAGIDGWSACGRLRSAGLPPGTRLLLCGGLHDHARLAELAEADPRRIDGFLTAPLTARGLTEVLLGAGGSLLGAASGVEGGGQRLAGLRLLVAEDNANNRQIARELLEGEGAVVTVVDDGLRAVGAVAAGPELFDAVLMDLQMPRLDGLAAARRIREELGLRKLPIVAMTANAMSSDREACLQAGMDDHVGKPFALAALVAVLQRLCRMGETGREALAAFPSRPVGPRLPAAAVWLAEIHGLDLDAAVERMGYRLDVYRRMLRRFAEGLPSQVPAMLQHGRDGQWDESHRAAHALKGLAATLGATALADTAARAEAAIGERCACDASMGALAALDAACGTASQVLQALAEALDGGSQPDTAPSGWCESTARASEPAHAADTVPAAPDDRVLRDGLAELDRLLEDSDMDALSCVESLRAAGERRFGSAWTTLDETVLLLDFGAARRECRRLMDTLGWTPIVMPA